MPSFWKVVNNVIEQAEVVLEVLDARLIDETRNIEIESKIKRANKKLVYVINKCDLVDKRLLDNKKKEIFPCVFVSSRDHLGTTLLRNKILEVARTGTKRDSKAAVIVGVVGYPNTGKSSVINALSGKAKAKTSPVSGYTTGIQLIKADNLIRLLDSPGVIPFMEEDEFKHALIGTIDSSKIKEPDYVAERLIEYLNGVIEYYYGVEKATDTEETLNQIALKYNKIKKGNIPDIEIMGRIIIKDWQHGKISLRTE